MRVSCGSSSNMVHHLSDTLRLQHQIVLRTIGIAGAREQEAQIIVDLGNGADRSSAGCAKWLSALSRSLAISP